MFAIITMIAVDAVSAVGYFVYRWNSKEAVAARHSTDEHMATPASTRTEAEAVQEFQAEAEMEYSTKVHSELLVIMEVAVETEVSFDDDQMILTNFLISMLNRNIRALFKYTDDVSEFIDPAKIDANKYYRLLKQIDVYLNVTITQTRPTEQEFKAFFNALPI